jgi:uncharacterized protein YbaP (TraB family)
MLMSTIRHCRIRLASLPLVLLVLLLLCPTVFAGPGIGFLWQVQGEKPLYLLGSIHLAEPGLYPLDPALQRAFEASDVLVVEADVTGPAGERAARLFMERGMLPAGESLEQRLPAKTLERLKSRGVDLGTLGFMRPWALALVLQSNELARLGYDPDLGVDVHFLRLAHARGMKVEELEGLEAQYDLFADMDPPEEEAFLVQTLDELDAVGSIGKEIIGAWRSGDAQALERVIFSELGDDPLAKRIHERIFLERNRTMAAKIERYLKNGRAAFVIVGAGHVVGEQGLVALLKQKGYLLTKVESGGPGNITQPSRKAVPETCAGQVPAR